MQETGEKFTTDIERKALRKCSVFLFSAKKCTIWDDFVRFGTILYDLERFGTMDMIE